MRVDAFAPQGSGAWIGLLARYVDANNHYYVTIRNNGQIQIRKIVNGVITVLASANFTAARGQYYRRAVPGHERPAAAVCGSRARGDGARSRYREGQYGLATYRAAANFSSLVVYQP